MHVKYATASWQTSIVGGLKGHLSFNLLGNGDVIIDDD